MDHQAQNVIDTPSNNTVFMVWNFHENGIVKDVFQRLCALVVNLNNSAQVRSNLVKASVVLGISHHAWRIARRKFMGSDIGMAEVSWASSTERKIPLVRIVLSLVS